MYARSRLVDASYYMNLRNINKSLQCKVIRYLEYMREEELYGYQRGNEFVDKLSNKLQEEILEDLYFKILKKNKIFAGNGFSEDFLKKLSLKMREITFAPGDIIFTVIIHKERKNLL